LRGLPEYETTDDEEEGGIQADKPLHEEIGINSPKPTVNLQNCTPQKYQNAAKKGMNNKDYK
jgi:hypothetical protein